MIVELRMLEHLKFSPLIGQKGHIQEENQPLIVIIPLTLETRKIWGQKNMFYVNNLFRILILL